MNDNFRSEADRKATMDFVIQKILIQNCGRVLSPNVVDEIKEEFKFEMYKGSCSWAFNMYLGS
jgi:hypothetical protein